MKYNTAFLILIKDWKFYNQDKFFNVNDAFKTYKDAYNYIYKIFPDAKYFSRYDDITDCFGEKDAMIYDWFECMKNGNRITIEIKPVKLHEII